MQSCNYELDAKMLTVTRIRTDIVVQRKSFAVYDKKLILGNGSAKERSNEELNSFNFPKAETATSSLKRPHATYR